MSAAQQSRDLTVVESAPPIAQMDIIRPLVTPEQAKAAIAAYEALKRAIVRDDDVQHIQGRDFLKKSFWRRIARYFGLSVELVREERLDLDGKVVYRVIYRAIAPNGQSMDGDGMMVYGEKGQTIEHNIRAIAHTRAKNRAISDLVGGGEVSAEEVADEDESAYERHTKPAFAELRQRAYAAHIVTTRGEWDQAIWTACGVRPALVMEQGTQQQYNQLQAHLAKLHEQQVTAQAGEEPQAEPESDEPESVTDAAAAELAEKPSDPWAEIRELAAMLGLDDEERAVIWKRHKKNRDKILTELRERYEAEQTGARSEPAAKAVHDLAATTWAQGA